MQNTITAMNSFLRFHDLTKSYYEGDVKRSVLQNAHAEFQPGEITAILGKSGSGKSTLLNPISGIDAPDSGQIWVEGKDLTALSERDRTLFRRARIGFVFQFFNLIPTLTVGENVSLPLELNRVPRPDALKKAQAMLEMVGLLDRWNTFPEKLSGETWRTATLFGNVISTFGICYNVDRLRDFTILRRDGMEILASLHDRSDTAIFVHPGYSSSRRGWSS